MVEETTSDKPRQFTKASSQKEYISGSNYDSDVSRILYRNSDALKLKKGDEIVEEMLRDAEIRKCDTVIKISVLSDGITFFPALSKPAPIKKLADGVNETIEQKRERLTREKEIERYELSEKYANFITRAVKNLDTPILSVLENMLDAITYGNKIAEQTYKEEYIPEFGKRLLTLESIRVKPRKSTRFVVDRFNKVVGFHGHIKVDGTNKPTIFPREKFLVLTFRGKDGDPRGQSILESVYAAWHLKMQLWPEYLRWLLQCAIPSLVGIAAPVESSSSNVLRDASTGQILRDEAGNAIYETDVSSLLNSLVNLRNASAIAVPNGAEVRPIANSVSGDPFKGMRDVLNEEIEMAMLLQTLATSEGRNMSRSAAQTHMSVLDLLIIFIKNLVMEMITNDLIKPLLAINFPNYDKDLIPNVSMGDVERRDWATDVTALATLWKSGFIGESQKVGYDKIISAPDRDEESDKQMLFEAEQQKLQNETQIAQMKKVVASYEKLNGEIQI